MPPIEIDKILSDPLLIVAAVLLVVSPVLFLIAFIKYLRTPGREPFAIPHHEMHSPLPTPKEVQQPADEQSLAAITPVEPPRSTIETNPEPEAPAGTPDAFPTPPESFSPIMPPPARRAESASEKTIVMPPGMAEMQSEMEIALSQLRVMNKRIAALEGEVARLRQNRSESPSGPVPPHPL